MSSHTPPSSPPTITVLHKECLGQISLSQLARDLNIDRSNLKRVKNWLIENRHPAFNGYIAGSSLNTDQAKAIISYRSYTVKEGLKGDALTEKMFPDTATAHAKKNALRDLFEQEQIPPEQAAQLTHSILRIFNS